MIIKLSTTVAPSGAVDEFDILQLKKGLNRLGYYQPYAKTGITGIPDKAIFESIKQFQRDKGLEVTGIAKPNDTTVKRLNQEVQKDHGGFYIWRTVEDEKVRPSHVNYNRTIRAWKDNPTPGDDYNCRCWAEPLSNSVDDRKNAILGKGKADFTLKPDVNPISDRPWYSLDMMSEVNQYQHIIEEEVREVGIDPDFIKAIIYVETTQGYYDRANLKNKSIRPMNLQAEYWKELGYSRDDLLNPRLNIRAGINLIHRIYLQIPHASISEVATLYNDLNAKRINDYGVRVTRIMR